MARIDVYKQVTDRILEAIESGTLPWRKSWQSIGSPISLQSGKPYRGINVILLSMAPFSSPYWLTYKEAKRRGGHVRKGEKGTSIVFWKWIEKKDKETDEVTDRFPILKTFYVFNAEQTDGVKDIPEVENVSEFTPIETAEKVVAGYDSPPTIKHGGDRASYAPSLDRIQMPTPESFDTREHYYGTLFHEMIHSTGHGSRLDRELNGGYGSASYAKEELVAEIGSSFLVNLCGIDPDVVFDNTAAYVNGWLKPLQDDKRLVVTAAAAAQKAAELILGDGSED